MPVSLERMRQIRSFEFDDWLLLVSPGHEGLFLLNPMSRYIWEALLSGCDAAEIAESLSAAFSRDYGEVAADIEKTTREWEATVLSTEYDPTPDAVEPIAAVDYGEARTFDFRLYGHNFRLLISDPALQLEIEQRFSPFEVRDSEFTPEFSFELALTELGYTITNAQGFRALSNRWPGAARVDLINALIGICFPGRKWLACLHAAALAKGDRCVLLCAPSGGGKSTLAAAMMACGFKLITDDLAYLDSQDLKVAGLPLALMLRAGSWSALTPVFPELSDLSVHEREGTAVRFLHSRYAETASSAQAEAIFFLNYQEGVDVELKPISNVDALVHIDQTSSWVDHSAERLPAFLRWLQGVTKYQLSYSNTADAVRLASAAPGE